MNLNARCGAWRKGIAGARLEAPCEIADGNRELAVDCIPRTARRGGVAGLVEDQHRARAEVAEQFAQTRDIGLVGHQRMRDEEARSGRPGIGAVTAILAQGREILAIDDREGETELRFQFVLPLPDHAGGRRYEHEVDASSKEQFANAPGSPRRSCPLRRRRRSRGSPGEGVELCEAAGAGSCPAECPHGRAPETGYGRPRWRCSGAGSADTPRRRWDRLFPTERRRPTLVGEDRRIEFGVPDHRNRFALRVVVDAGETHRV